MKLPAAERVDFSRPQGTGDGGPGSRPPEPGMSPPATPTLTSRGPRGRPGKLGGCGQLRVKAPRSRKGETKGGGPGCPAAPGREPPPSPRGVAGAVAGTPLPAGPGEAPTALPVILSLQELEFVFDPVTRLRHREFKSRLPGLMGSLEPARTRQGRGRGRQTGLRTAPAPRRLLPVPPAQPGRPPSQPGTLLASFSAARRGGVGGGARRRTPQIPPHWRPGFASPARMGSHSQVRQGLGDRWVSWERGRGAA